LPKWFSALLYRYLGIGPPRISRLSHVLLPGAGGLAFLVLKRLAIAPYCGQIRSYHDAIVILPFHRSRWKLGMFAYLQIVTRVAIVASVSPLRSVNSLSRNILKPRCATNVCQRRRVPSLRLLRSLPPSRLRNTRDEAARRHCDSSPVPRRSRDWVLYAPLSSN
jgi:hypothetical protein